MSGHVGSVYDVYGPRWQWVCSCGARGKREQRTEELAYAAWRGHERLADPITGDSEPS